MYKDHDLMEQLNDLSSADMPLTGAELSRLTKTVLKQVGREQKRKKVPPCRTGMARLEPGADQRRGLRACCWPG